MRDRSSGLSMMQRRLLILVDSKRTAEEITKEIDAKQSREDLQALVDAWYQALADNPANLTRVYGIRSTLLAKPI